MTYETEARIREAFQEERDQLKAEIERLRDIIRGGNCIRDSDGKSECEWLRRERDALRQDVERYRCARDRHKDFARDLERVARMMAEALKNADIVFGHDAERRNALAAWRELNK